MNFEYKYLKYKQKYLSLQNQKGGEVKCIVNNKTPVSTLRANIDNYNTSIKSVVFHPTNNDIMATCSVDKTAKLWQKREKTWTCIATLDGILNGHTKTVETIAFHPTSVPIILATGSWDHTVKLWEIINNEKKKTWSANHITTLKGHSESVYSVAFHPIYPILISGSLDKTIKVWQLCANNYTATCVLTINNESSVFSVSFHPTANPPIIAAGCGRKNYNEKIALIKLWRLTPYYKEGILLKNLEGHQADVNSIVFDPKNPNIMASGSSDSTARLWELNFDDFNMTKSVGTIGDITDYKHRNEIGAVMKGNNGTIYSVAFHPKQNILVIGSSSEAWNSPNYGGLTWWKYQKRDISYEAICEKRIIYANSGGNMNYVAYNNSGEELAAACDDGWVRFYG